MGFSREYPVAPDRGGIPEDFDNFSNFLARLRSRLNSSGRRFGLSITLVCSKQFNYRGMLRKIYSQRLIGISADLISSNSNLRSTGST